MASFTISDAPQGSQEWLDIRKSLKATGSKFGSIYLHINNKYPKSWLEEPSKPNFAMEMGTACEPIVRKWFTTSKWWQQDWTMNEVGIAIPNFDSCIGSSVDGLITDKDGNNVAIIEIKCPNKVYSSLLTPRCYTTLSEHIPFTHYAQMQGAMAILNIPKCFYICYGHGRDEDGLEIYTPQIYVEEVSRNETFWKEELYPAIRKYTKC